MNQNEVLIEDFHNNDQLDVIKDGVDKFIEGYKGECFVRHWLKKQNINFFEPDLIVNEKGQYYIYEIKVQKHFVSPPFDGHGLPLWQIKDRLNFCEKNNIKCKLIIIDLQKKFIYYQDLDILYKEYGNEKMCYQTNGENRRCIFNLVMFNKTKLI